MIVKVKLFAALKDHFDSSMEIELKQDATISDLVDYLINMQTKSMDLLSVTRFAIDNELVNKDYPLNDDSQIFLYPPSSGG